MRFDKGKHARRYPPDFPSVPAGTPRVLFEIDPVDPYGGCSSFEATVLAGPCTGSPAVGDTITVYDHAGCFFDVPSEDLEGLRGFASKLRVELYENGYPTGQFECRWIVDSLCCGAAI